MMRALEWRASEQPAVEKGDRAEGAGDRRTTSPWRIECSEEQRAQAAIVKSAAPRDAEVVLVCEEGCVTGRGGFHNRCLRPLFFGTLNTPRRRRSPVACAFGAIPFLNGGLFTRTPLERAHHGLAFSDDAYGGLIYDLFSQYRFTAREESATWTEAAVDPEMLGRAFESLMAATERRRTGAFFTPFALVERVADAGLDAALAHTSSCALTDLTVLD